MLKLSSSTAGIVLLPWGRSAKIWSSEDATSSDGTRDAKAVLSSATFILCDRVIRGILAAQGELSSGWEVTLRQVYTLACFYAGLLYNGWFGRCAFCAQWEGD